MKIRMELLMTLYVYVVFDKGLHWSFSQKIYCLLLMVTSRLLILVVSSLQGILQSKFSQIQLVRQNVNCPESS